MVRIQWAGYKTGSADDMAELAAVNNAPVPATGHVVNP
jgi:hypothetical protein